MRSVVTQRELDELKPYLLGEVPRDNGEWDMFCPLHEDENRSASLNVYEAVWFCNRGCGGGPIGQLMDARESWLAPSSSAHLNGSANGNGAPKKSNRELPADAKISGWNAALLDNVDGTLDILCNKRGLTVDTIKRYELGWNMSERAYSIPVRDAEGKLLNVRYYQPDPPQGRRKIWGITDHNKPQLYPVDQLEHQEIIVCEGELDALITIQSGFPAITRTGSATTWHGRWNRLFQGKLVYLCHDCDEAGEDGNRKVGNELAKLASEIKVIRLPYGIVDKHGKDLTDFWLEHDAATFRELLERALLVSDPRLTPEVLPEDATVLDALDSRRARQPLRLTLTIEGKAGPGYTIPKRAQLTCDRNAGEHLCMHCPLFTAQGSDVFEVQSDETVLELMDISTKQVQDLIRRRYGAKCKTHVSIEAVEEQAVETLFGRASIDHTSNSTSSADFTTLRIRHVGGHDTPANETVQVIGALYPSPKTQANEFVASEVLPVETSLDRFELDPDIIRVLKRFQPKEGQSTLKKMMLISKELETHVTHIYGRREMHVAMDLVFHSVLAFEFDRQLVERGWLELLVVGDTRTGKSEVAQKLVRHYRAGEIVSCETASLPGILGAVHQPTGQQWSITWGKIPLNDRRLVVLDEVDGLKPHEISSLSHLRSSGIAEISKVKAGRTRARCRLLWLGNPRQGKMADYTFGTEALEPLIGKPEDIARFDLAMTVALGEVASEEMNRPHQQIGLQRYSSEACHALLRWAWSRHPDQIQWTAEAESEVFAAAKDMGSRYIESPPLVQAANVRIKIARVAVALAARTFSTDYTCERVVVTREHVRCAVAFFDRLYGMPGFGYRQRSSERLQAENKARSLAEEAALYLRGQPELRSFLRDREGWFKRWDLESFLNISREEANAIINKFWKMNMLEGHAGDVRPARPLREILRRSE